jgi:F0F1-type ATP synthase assembly protein I
MFFFLSENHGKVQHNDDDRSMMARGWSWGHQAMSISLEMVVPGLLGLWVDRQVGTLPLFLILGVIFGMTAGMIHLMQFARRINEQGSKGPKNEQDRDV